MDRNEKPSTESWDNFGSNWIKHEHFKEFPAETFVAGVNSDYNDNEQGVVILDLQYEGRKWKKQLNKSDMDKLKELKVPNPKALVNHAIIWTSCKVFNPSSKKQQDSIAVEGFRE